MREQGLQGAFLHRKAAGATNTTEPGGDTADGSGQPPVHRCRTRSVVGRRRHLSFPSYRGDIALKDW
jgi:hypothetical protein